MTLPLARAAISRRGLLVVPLLNMVLGLVISVSAFTLERSAAGLLLVSLYLGPLVVLFSAMALDYRTARYGATLCGAGLVLEAVLSPHFLGSSPGRAFDLLSGVAVIALSLLRHPQFATNQGEESLVVSPES